MSDLLDVKTAKGKFFFTVLFVVLAVGIFIGAYIVPQSNKIKKLETDLTNVEEQLRMASIKVNDLEKMNKNWPLVKQERSTLDSLIPNAQRETEVVEFIHYLGQLTSCDIESVEVASPVELPVMKIADDKKTSQESSLDNKLVRSIRRLDISMRIAGKFNDILGFLDYIKLSNRYVEINEISIPDETSARELPDSMPMVISGCIYFYSKDLADVTKKEGTELEKMLESQGMEKYLDKPAAGEKGKPGGKSAGKGAKEEEKLPNTGEEVPPTELNGKGKKPAKDVETDENAGKIEDSGQGTTVDADLGGVTVGSARCGLWICDGSLAIMTAGFDPGPFYAASKGVQA